jgi:hypothetical protein
VIIKILIDENESDITDNEIKQDIKYLILDYLTSQGFKIRETKVSKDVEIVTE